MQEITGNLFDYINKVDIICITTNGFVKANGECVMGKGCAKEATRRWPGIAKILGSKLQEGTNIVHRLIQEENTIIASFPVKPVCGVCKEDHSNVVRNRRNEFNPRDKAPGCAAMADPTIFKAITIY